MRLYQDGCGRIYADRGMGFVPVLGQGTAPVRNVAANVIVSPTYGMNQNVAAFAPPATISQPPCPPPGYPNHTVASGTNCCVPQRCVSPSLYSLTPDDLEAKGKPKPKGGSPKDPCAYQCRQGGDDAACAACLASGL